MAFNIHSLCNNKLKIKIKLHRFMYEYFWKSSGSFAANTLHAFLIEVDTAE
jgi:hypothetical protein